MLSINWLIIGESFKILCCFVFEMESKELPTRKLIVEQFIQNSSLSCRKIAQNLNVAKSTVFDVLKRYKQSLTTDRKTGTGLKSGPVNKDLATKIKRSFIANPGLSDNDRATRYGTSRTYVQKLRSQCGMKSYRAIKYPNRTDKQD